MEIKLPYLKKNGKYVLESVLDIKTRIDNRLKNPFPKPMGLTEEQIKKKSEAKFLKELGQEEYDYLGFFQEGFALARIKEKLFLIDYNEDELNIKLADVNGKKIEIVEIKNFENGLARAKSLYGDWYLINKSGLKVNPYSFDSIHSTIYEDGFLHGFIGSHPHLIHPSGAEILLKHKEKYNNWEAKNYKIGNNVILLQYAGSFHRAIDYNGNELFNTKNFKWITKFDSGKAIGESLDNKLFILDKELNCISLPEEITSVDQTLLGFNNGFCIVKANDVYSIINNAGELKFQASYMWPFSNGFATVFEDIKGESKCYAINKSFERITPSKYDEISSFKEGIASYKLGNKWGYINIDGIEITPALFDEAFNCINGFMEVGIGDFRDGVFYGKYGFYNRYGEKVCPIIYDSTGSFDDRGFARIKLGEYWGLLNMKGEEVIKPRFDSIDEQHKDYYFVSVGRKRFVIDNTGHNYSDEDYYRDELGNILASENLPF